MTSFSIELPADPKWLHVARASTLAGVSVMPSAHVDFLDDATLAVGESVLEVAVTPGVEQLAVHVETSDERFGLLVEGVGDEVEHDVAKGSLFELVLRGLTDDVSTEISGTRYAVRVGMPAPQHG
jgi:hypothetical protein